MENIFSLDEYFSKFNFIDKIDSIKNNINNIQENYKELNKYYKDYFIFPTNEYKIIEDSIKNIKEKVDINIEIYNDLNKLLKDFSQKIKESSYENKFLNNIRNNNYEIIKLNNEIYSMLLNNLINKDLSSTKNLDGFENENTTKDYENFYLKDKSSTNINENNYQISFTCSTDKCSNDVKYFCQNHCYKYYCEKCKEEYDEEFSLDQFKEITKLNKSEEIQKITFINSFNFIHN